MVRKFHPTTINQPSQGMGGSTVNPVDTHVNPVGPVHTAETENVETVNPVEPKKEYTVKQPVVPAIKPIVEIPVVKSSVPEVKYREVVYLGIAQEAERGGAVTGNVYVFKKDAYRMPESTQVDERDYPALIAERGKGCARRDASILFMSKLEWNLELEQARIANSS